MKTNAIEFDVTVIIPLYNKGKYIRRAIDSVLSQTLLPSKIIVIDDGSTDNGAEIIQTFNNPLITIIKQSNQGVASARNHGILKSSTKWVAFLDADDEYYKGFLAETSQIINKYPEIDFLFTNIYDINLKRARISEDVLGGIINDYYDFCMLNKGMGATSSSIIINRKILIISGGFPSGVKIGEDLDTWFRLAMIGNCYYVNKILAKYHSEAADSAMKNNMVTLSSGYDAVINSYSNLNNMRLIPPHRIRSSAAYINHLQLEKVEMYIELNQYKIAKNIFYNSCNPLLSGWKQYIIAFLQIYIPKRILMIYRYINKYLILP